MAQTALPNTFFGGYDPAAGWQRDATLAQNARTRFLIQQRGARDLADIDIAGAKGIEGLAGAYNKRGLRFSGMQNTGQNDYAKSWMQQKQNALQSIYDELAGLSFSDATAGVNFQQSQADFAAQKYQQILQSAAQLNTMRPYLGG